MNRFILRPDGTTKMSDYQYYLFFAGLMLVTALIFAVVASFYRGRTYVQGSDAAEADIAVAT